MIPVRQGGGDRAVSRAYLVPDSDATGTVHSVFATACNLAVAGTLVTVHDAGAPHTPTSVRMRSCATGAWSPRAQAGDPVRFRAGVLSFSGHVCDLRRLSVWAPGPVPQPVDAAAVGRLAGCVGRAREQHLRGRGFPAFELEARAEELQAALHSGPSATDGAVRRLIGFGPGLTPAGDDLLVGLMAMLYRLRPVLPSAGQALRAIVHAVRRDAHRTTDISAHHLRLAAAGAFGEPITGLLDAIAGGAARTVVAARTEDVLRLGASSGADAVAGVVLGVRALVPPPDEKAP
ncbi:DUF2877 domain-containing protein [Streptomyces puniciscabiei]